MYYGWYSQPPYKAKIMQAYMQPSLIQVLDAEPFLPVLDAADFGDIGADGNSLYFYRPKIKGKKIIFNTAK